MKEFARKFYKSSEWEKTRNFVMMRDNYLCQFPGCCKPAEEVHHITHINEKNIDDPLITMNPDNLISLCKNHHFEQHRIDYVNAVKRSNKRRKHTRIVNEDGTYFDENGNLVMRKVHIVYGSPRSGKSTYVKNNMEQGDIIIDTDRIIAALQGDELRHIDNNILFLAMDVKEFLINELEKKSKNFDCRNVWIIIGAPYKQEREELAKRLNADLIYIDCPIKETLERAVENPLYDNNQQYAIDVVNEWWKKFER